MSEKNQILILLIIVTLVGFVGLFLTGGMAGMESACGLGGCGDVYVDSYSANLYLNGTLEENFGYEIKEPFKYRMLYRDWKVPISYGIADNTTNKTNPHIELISILSPPGTVAYIKDFQGNTKVISNADAQYTSEISSLAAQDEVGTYNPGRFDAGQYKISYVFRLHPPLECDKEYCHLNLKLADEHLPYKHVTLTIHDPDGLIEGVFPHPITDAQKNGDTWVIEGVSAENTLLEIEILLKPSIVNVMDAFPRNIPGVKDKTLSANSEYSLISGIFSTLVYALRAMVLLFPVLIAFVYYKYGREKIFTVP